MESFLSGLHVSGITSIVLVCDLDLDLPCDAFSAATISVVIRYSVIFFDVLHSRRRICIASFMPTVYHFTDRTHTAFRALNLYYSVFALKPHRLCSAVTAMSDYRFPFLHSRYSSFSLSLEPPILIFTRGRELHRQRRVAQALIY